MAKAWDRLDDVTRTVVTGNFAGVSISSGVVDYEDLIGRRLQSRYTGKALLEECGSVSSADDDGDTWGQLP